MNLVQAVEGHRKIGVCDAWSARLAHFQHCNSSCNVSRRRCILTSHQVKLQFKIMQHVNIWISFKVLQHIWQCFDRAVHNMIWNHICCEYNWHKTIVVTFYPHSRLFAFFLLHKKVSKSRQNKYCNKTVQITTKQHNSGQNSQKLYFLNDNAKITTEFFHMAKCVHMTELKCLHMTEIRPMTEFHHVAQFLHKTESKFLHMTELLSWGTACDAFDK